MCQTNSNKPSSYYANMISRYQALEQRSDPSAVHANINQRQPKEGLNIAAFSEVKQSKREVTFKPTAKVRLYTPAHDNKHSTKEEKSKLYYSKDELKVFNLEAQAICTLSQELPDIRNSGTLMVGVSDDCTTDSLRGLELMMFPKRRQNKILMRKSLLKYQTLLNSRPDMDSEQKHKALAVASAKFNLWASNVARDTACLDAMRVFEGEYLIPVDVPTPVTFDFPLMCYRKRRQVSSDAAVDASPQIKRRKIC